MKDNVLSVHIYVTPVCNLRCKHCYVDSKPVSYVPKYLLTPHEIGDAAATLCDNFDTSIEMEGGAFFLREDIYELFDILPSPYWHRVTLTTSGTVEIKVDASRLMDLEDFRVSIEGHTEEIHQIIRGAKLNPILKKCQYLRSKGVPISLRVTLHKRNYHYLEDMVASLLKQGFSKFSFFEFQPVGRGRDCADEFALDEGDFEQLVRCFCERPIFRTVELCKISISRRRLPILEKYRDLITNSGATWLDISGTNSLTINYDGKLGICPWVVGKDSIGEYKNGSFLADVYNFINKGLLKHTCDYCSVARLQFKL